MELLNYLQNHFFTKQELLEISKVTDSEFQSYQDAELMPKCSYKLELSLQSDSFFGLHKEEQQVEFYAKGYSSWLAVIQSEKSTDSVYSVFTDRYKKAVESLYLQGHSSGSSKLTTQFDEHVKEEWGHFINGIYGLCTKSGLPEDIAAKELSILEINELLAESELSENQIDQLTRAVDLLDSASSLFAPHERLKSSRYRLVDEVRRNYKLKS
ncbi:hypothetical protein D5R81_20130 [Parashewanella spongiae]|uniref:Orphan protein n=1 Tax=Parashewanella spongiae TaxID=342950 RepID=A0A3A6T155_9GAMM|nr:DUF6058 family natural product biosynthesis protein [Parashewanella spongiae]MCL1080329.1 DUF6058 family natural product biosynthesis protein [Parashewanella spongiae]RJY00350.1 hypothetical protein D5R81_20130 [Parashewanella spongiae]